MNRAQRRVARGRLLKDAPVILIAALFLISSLSFFIDPGEIGGTLPHLPPWDYYWNILYTIGGFFIIAGILTRRVGVEAAGHICVVPGLALNFFLAVGLVGFHRITLLTTIFGIGLALRAYGLLSVWWEVGHDA
jgi:hypothetical protein